MAKSTSANLGFEEKLWAAADKMRNNMDPSEYKHVVLGLIFLKYISDSFEELHEKLKTDKLADPEDKDEYLAENVFWVPQEARWDFLLQNAKKSEIGKIVDDAMVAIEKENPSLKSVLPKDYARPTLDKQRLGELIDLIGTIGLGDKENRSKDVLGRVYEYFIGRFASAEGKSGGEFFTPQSVVKLLVSMLEPYKGRVFDPCCGSGGMFVQSEQFVESHGGRVDDVSIFGQESNATTWRLCKMNLAIRGIESKHIYLGDSFHNDQHKDLKADFILANSPFNVSDWGGERLREDVRWKYGTPPTGNANYGWIQHFVHHLSPTGIAGFVMANGSLSSNSTSESEIRKNLVKKGLVDCIVAMPDKLFYTTQIPACLWFVSRDRYDNKFRDRHNEVLFIDARKLGKMTDRKHRELTAEDLEKISSIYHNWRNRVGKYEDVKGICRAVSVDEIEKNGFVLTPGRYVGITNVKDERNLFNDDGKATTEFFNDHFSKMVTLEKQIQKTFSNLGYTYLSKMKFSVAQNNVLEIVAQNMFKRWFIDYEFPSNSGKSYKAAGKKMVKSELGEIPEGWEIKDLGYFSDIINGFAFRSEDYREKGIFLLRTRNFSQSEYIVKDEAVFLPEDYLDKFKKYQLKKFDTLLVMVGASVGQMGFVTSNVLPALQNQNMWNFRAKDMKNQIFLKFLVSNIVKENIGSASGSARDFFRKDYFRTIKFVLPDKQILRKFDDAVLPMFEMIDLNLGAIAKVHEI